MDKICVDADKVPFTVDDEAFLGRGGDPDHKADVQGCGAFNPVVVLGKRESASMNAQRRRFQNGPNRRVNLFLLQEGTRIDPDSWPCPKANEPSDGCKERFWSDGEKRRQPGAKRRTYANSRDTYGCRFYERMAIAVRDPTDPASRSRLVLSWSKGEVTPDHNTKFPPASPPTDTVPDEAKVSLLVDTQGVVDGTGATIEIKNAKTDALAPGGRIEGLKVQGDKVVDPATGAAPQFVFRAPDLWEPFDAPLYYFSVTIDQDGLTGASSKDYANEPDKVLRLLFWHVSISDAIADTPAGGGLTTGDEMWEIAGLHTENPHRKVLTTAFNLRHPTVAQWGSVLRNAYGYHHASHGDVRCRVDGNQFNANAAGDQPTTCPINPAHAGRSVVFLGDEPFGDKEIGNVARVPSVPRHLLYLDTCVAGFEPSFGRAALARGARYVLAFRKYIPDNDARKMARQFYKKWIQVYEGDPDKIAQVFFEVGPAYFGTMRPVLFGAGGGRITSASASAIAGSLATALA
jgi:hypothetical protein